MVPYFYSIVNMSKLFLLYLFTIFISFFVCLTWSEAEIGQQVTRKHLSLQFQEMFETFDIALGIEKTLGKNLRSCCFFSVRPIFF